MGKESCPQFAKARGRCPMGDIFQYGPASPLQVSLFQSFFCILEHIKICKKWLFSSKKKALLHG